ncbi:MAG: tripartite tricarboxylate transporter substrate-binding protein [Burkholderiales bacterium]|nr:tripartite tricarboxylate transporter substrate-binding protein [Burkholderiales bacterium]
MKASWIALAAVVVTLSAQAAEKYPARPIRMVMPSSPGGANDVVGRMVMQKVSEIMGLQIVVDNRGGAGGAIGAEIAAEGAPDGYTLLAATYATHTMIPLLQKSIRYHPERDFAPIALFVVQYSMMSAHPSFQPSTVKELIALAKAKPGTINYGSAGPGSTSHFTGLMFAKLAGIDITIVPYKGGGPLIIALLAGETQFNFGPLPASVPHIRAGKLKAIAVSGPERSLAMPEVPTVAESGLPAFSQAAWVGLVAPAGTPRAILDQLHAAVNRSLESTDLRQQLIRIGAEPAPRSRAGFAQFLRNEYQRYARLVNDLGLKPK